MSNGNISALKPLSWVVKSALNRVGIYSDKNMLRYQSIAAEYFSEQLNMYTLENTAVAYMNFDGTRIKQLPPDFVDYLTVGININGEFWTLGRNRHLTPQRKMKCLETIDEIGSSAAAPNYGYLISDHVRDGNYVGGLMTVGGGFNTAYFNIEVESTGRKMLVIDGYVPKGEVIVEYTSTGVTSDGTALVPHHAVGCVRSYLLWQMCEYDERTPDRTKERRRRDFLEEETMCDWYIGSMTADEIRDIFYQSYHQGLKR